jgi:uncharacterized protein YndB with AHSA1/START domain
VTELGRYVELDGRPAVRFERTYRHPVERVWTAITDADDLVHWFPSAVQMEPHPGGKVVFTGDPHTEGTSGTILAFDPPRHLAFSWGPDELRFDLEPVDEDHCTLILTNLLSERDTAARNASGWAVCLAELDKRLGGQPSQGPHSDDALLFEPLYDAHLDAGLPSGAEIPGGLAD